MLVSERGDRKKGLPLMFLITDMGEMALSTGNGGVVPATPFAVLCLSPVEDT